jgi:hypothetical protein
MHSVSGSIDVGRLLRIAWTTKTAPGVGDEPGVGAHVHPDFDTR